MFLVCKTTGRFSTRNYLYDVLLKTAEHPHSSGGPSPLSIRQKRPLRTTPALQGAPSGRQISWPPCFDNESIRTHEKHKVPFPPQ